MQKKSARSAARTLLAKSLEKMNTRSKIRMFTKCSSYFALGFLQIIPWKFME